MNTSTYPVRCESLTSSVDAEDCGFGLSRVTMQHIARMMRAFHCSQESVLKDMYMKIPVLKIIHYLKG